MVKTAFVAVAIALGLLASVAWYGDKKLLAATDLVAHTLEVLTTLEKITSHIAQAEAAQRGYLLLQSPNFLTERDQALDAAHVDILAIEQMTADSLSQRRRIAELNGLLSQRIAAADAMLKNLDSLDVLARVAYFAEGAALSAKLRDLADEMQAEEKKLLVVRSADETKLIRSARGSFVLLMGSLLIVLLFLTRRIHRDIGRQEEAAEELRIAHDELETRVQQRTAELETVNRFLKVEIAGHEQAEKALHEAQYLLHQLAAHHESIREDERKRIAREIHDELGQSLLVLRIDVTLLQTRTFEPHTLFPEKISAVLEDISTIMRSVRAIINDLRPAVLDLGLHASIEWQLKQFQLRTGIECVLLPSSQEVALTDNVATSLFRILQESLTNIGRHSEATRVVVELNANQDNVLMTVSDNGIGTASGYSAKKDSFGLLGMKERISMLGGRVEIATAQGSGFKVAVSIPSQAGVALEKS